MNDKLIKRDILRLADAIDSINLWEQEQASPGSIFPGTEYEAPERIDYYTQKEAKYRGRVLKHIGVSPNLVEIVVNILKPLFKNTVIEKILELIF